VRHQAGSYALRAMGNSPVSYETSTHNGGIRRQPESVDSPLESLSKAEVDEKFAQIVVRTCSRTGR